ncbi:MAG: PilX N-terminal domain-containing pilus assembly protein [Methylococcaceae bacterium]
MKISSIETSYHQKGATLATSLIILLVMTLVGITAMRTNILEEKMVNNDRQYKIALHTAELALREGEGQINPDARYSNVISTHATTSGMYLASAATTIEWWNTVGWDDVIEVRKFGLASNGTTVTASSTVIASLSSTVGNLPSYIIEQLPVPDVEKDSKEAGIALTRNYYRVTSRALVIGTEAKVMLQSTYKK